jgi:hypothetical protein
MKSRLNLTIDHQLLEAAKAYAASKRTSLSELFENYLKTLSRPAKRKSVLDLLDKLEKPKIDTSIDLKNEFYKERSKKYGF